MTIVPGSLTKHVRVSSVERAQLVELYAEFGRRGLAKALGTDVATIDWLITGYGGRVTPAKLARLRPKMTALGICTLPVLVSETVH